MHKRTEIPTLSHVNAPIVEEMSPRSDIPTPYDTTSQGKHTYTHTHTHTHIHTHTHTHTHTHSQKIFDRLFFKQKYTD